MENKQSLSTIKTTLLIIGSCLMYALSGGLRANYGIIINPICDFTGIAYADASFAFGVAQLMYGLTQPFWGALAFRKSNSFVLLLGIPCMVIGLLGIPFSTGKFTLSLFLGILMASGTGALSFTLIMSAISPILGVKKAAAVSGILNASSGIGQAILSPVLSVASGAIGIRAVLYIYCIPLLAVTPIVLWIGRLNRNLVKASSDSTVATDSADSSEIEADASVAESANVSETTKKRSVIAIFQGAFASPDYRALMIGFSTCGFHMTIMQTHLISQFTSYGISETTSAMLYTCLGVATMVGSVLSGILCSRFHLKNVLGSLYGTRAIIVLLYIFIMPKNVISSLIFAIVLGMTGDATVTPTSEIISRRFGPGSMALLFGITYVCHQIGGFISSWLGGVFVQGGNYTTIWLMDLVVCALAAFFSYRIKVKENE